MNQLQTSCYSVFIIEKNKIREVESEIYPLIYILPKKVLQHDGAIFIDIKIQTFCKNTIFPTKLFNIKPENYRAFFFFRFSELKSMFYTQNYIFTISTQFWQYNVNLYSTSVTYSHDILLLPGKGPDSLNECIWFRLKTLHSVGQHSKSSLYYIFIKQSLIYNQNYVHAIVVQCLPGLDFRAALNPSTMSADVELAGS